MSATVRDSSIFRGPSFQETSILEARNLIVDFHVAGRCSRALSDVSLSIKDGEAVGLIGESGSGKTTLSRVLLGLVRPTHGYACYRGRDIYTMRTAARHRTLSRETALIFQDPRSSLNPRLSVGAVIRDPLCVQRIGTRQEQNNKVSELLESVGLPAQLGTRSVRSLSGGQLQRVALARALALEPSVIIADEPTSALDVSVQAQILNLLQDIRKTRPVALLVISHDMRVIRFLTERTAVMFQGKIVEEAATRQIYENPEHEYTKTLLAATPALRPAGENLDSFGAIPEM